MQINLPSRAQACCKSLIDHQQVVKSWPPVLFGKKGYCMSAFTQPVGNLLLLSERQQSGNTDNYPIELTFADTWRV